MAYASADSSVSNDALIFSQAFEKMKEATAPQIIHTANITTLRTLLNFSNGRIISVVAMTNPSTL